MRINRVPFLLWLTDKRDDLSLDFKNQKVTSSELGESTITPVSIYVIALLKYFPILILAIFFYYPKSLVDLGVLSVAVAVLGVVLFLVRFDSLLKIFLILFCFVNIYFVIQNNNYATYLSTGITFFVELLLIGAVVYDIFVLKGYKNWYFLDSFKRNINIAVAQKKEKKFLFFKNKKTGFDVKKSFSIKGYFLKLGDVKWKRYFY